MQQTAVKPWLKGAVFLLILLLALVIVPQAADADQQISVTVSFAYGDNFEFTPQKVTVSAGLAASYGIGEASSSPTVLDAAVAAHKAKYGAAFTTETAGDYLSSDFSKLFGHTGFAGHIINGHYSSDLASGALLQNGDNVDLLLYEDSNWSDHYAFFSYNGSQVRELSIAAGEPLNLQLQGYNIMGAYLGEQIVALSGVALGTAAADGSFTPLEQSSDNNGEISLSFNSEGTYLLLAAGTYNGCRVVPAWCEITVSGQIGEDQQQQAVTEALAALSLPDTVSSSLTLPKSSTDGKVSFSWSSSDPSIIAPDGTVYPRAEAQSVTMTVTASYGDYSDSKQFQITVTALGDEQARQSIAAARALLTATALTPNEYSGYDEDMEMGYFADSAADDTNILTMARELVTDPAVSISLKSSANAAISAPDGAISYGENECSGNITFILSAGQLSEEHSVELTVPAHLSDKTEFLQQLLAELTLDDLGDEPLSASFYLPAELDTFDSDYMMATCELSWTSSRPDLLKIASYSSNYGYQVSVTQPLETTTVTLTVTASYDTTYDAFMGCLPPGPMPTETISKSFEVEVAPLSDEQKEQLTATLEAALATITADKITISDSEEIADLSAITTDLQLYDFNWDRNNPYYGQDIDISWYSSNPAAYANTLRLLVTRPAGSDNASGTLTVTATKNGVSVSKDFAITVLADPDAVANTTISDAISGIRGYLLAQDSSWYATADWWFAAGLSQVRQQLSAEQKQALVDTLIALAEEGTVSSLTNAINGLAALGYDPTQLTTSSGASLNAVAELNKIDLATATQGYFLTIAPYTLLALQQTPQGSATLANDIIDYLLQQQNSDGGWGWQAGVSDIDSTAMILQGLSCYTDTNSRAAAAVNAGLSWLRSAFGRTSNNSFGNASSDAMAIIAIAANGIDPARDSNYKDYSSGKTLVDGLLSYLDADNCGFDSGDAFSTKQGLLGLVAAAYAANGQTVNALDFSSLSKVPAAASSDQQLYQIEFRVYDYQQQDITSESQLKLAVYTADGQLCQPQSQGSYQLAAGSYSYTVSYPDHSSVTRNFLVSKDSRITVELEIDGICVTFRLIGDDKHGEGGHSGYLTWYATREYIVAEDSTAWDLARTALNEAGLSYTWKNGYLSAIASPLTGIKLAELDNGSASGWMYTVNGQSPDVSINEYTLTDGDKIILYYTDNYTASYSGFAVRDTDPSTNTLKTTLAELIDTAQQLLDETLISVDGSDVPLNQQWVKQSAYTALQKALTQAEKDYRNAATFNDYQQALNDLAQAVEKFRNQLSYGLQALTAHFSDVPTSYWAFADIEQLYAQGVIKGKTATTFAPEATITRAEFITMLARLSGDSLGYGNGGFSDVDSNSYYAAAVNWGVRHGIIKGTSATTFSPHAAITREQMATMIYRYALYQGYSFSNSGNVVFSDQQSISDWALTAVSSLHQAGIITGNPGGTYLPQHNAKRAEAATILNNAAKIIN